MERTNGLFILMFQSCQERSRIISALLLNLLHPRVIMIYIGSLKRIMGMFVLTNSVFSFERRVGIPVLVYPVYY